MRLSHPAPRSCRRPSRARVGIALPDRREAALHLVDKAGPDLVDAIEVRLQRLDADTGSDLGDDDTEPFHVRGCAR